MRILIALVMTLLMVCGAGQCQQNCPHANPDGPDIESAPQTLRGRLIFHDDLRKWFELKLAEPHCGQISIQLISMEIHASIEELRGCHVVSTGPLGDAGTGYYSLGVFQSVQNIASVGSCTKQPPFPDVSRLRPAAWVHSYRVAMDVNYRPGDHPIRFRVWTGAHALSPWQAYASYELTGDFVLYGHCGKGFVVDRVSGPRLAKPGHFDEPGTPADMAMYDPEGAAAAGLHDLRLGYSCLREGRMSQPNGAVATPTKESAQP